jgi:DNA repair exonuclease SbcCD ATPase subunit
MSDNQPNTDPSPAPTTQTPPDSRIAELEARIKGLQKALNEKHGEMLTETEKLRGTLSAKDSETVVFRTKLTDAEKQLKEIQESLTATTTKLSAAEKAAAKAEKMREAAKRGLLDDFDSGLLNTDLEGENWTKHLDAFAARVNSAVTNAKEQLLQGGTPPAGGATRPGTQTAKELTAQMAAAMAKGTPEGRAEYEELYSRLVALKE